MLVLYDRIILLHIALFTLDQAHIPSAASLYFSLSLITNLPRVSKHKQTTNLNIDFLCMRKEVSCQFWAHSIVTLRYDRNPQAAQELILYKRL